MKQFAFKGVSSEIQASHYSADGSPAWWIGEGPDIVVITVCLQELRFDPPQPGYLYVKDYSYHEGVADALVEQGVCELAARIDINGHGSKIAVMRVLT